jgi:hypothetical protein
MVDFADTSTAGDPLVINALRRAAGLPPLVPPGLVMGREIPVAPGAPAAAPAATSTPYLRTPELRPAAASTVPVASTGSAPLTAGSGLPALRPGALTPLDPNDPKYQALQPHGLERAGLTIASVMGGPFSGLASRALYAPEVAYNRDVAARKEQLANEDTQSQIEERRAQGARAQAAADKPESIDQELATATMKAIRSGADPAADPTVKSLITIHNEAADKAGGPKLKEVKVDDQGNAIGVMDDGSKKDLGFKAGKEAGATTYEHATIEDPKKPGTGKEALFDKGKGQYLDPDTKQPIANAKPFMKPETSEKGTEVVRGFSKDGRPVLTSAADAKTQGLTKITKATDKDIDSARTHTVVLNDMQAKLNDVVASSTALNQSEGQRAIIAKALSDTKNGTFDSLIRAGALSKATDATKNYIQSVLSLRESALGLPKEITGGSRVSEVQSSALWATLPSASSLDSKYALGQAKKFQANIDRLWKRVDDYQGLPHEAPAAELAGGGAAAGAGAATGLKITRDAHGRIVGVE